MYSFLSKLAAWLVQKLAIAVLIVVLGLSTYALWLFIQDQKGIELRQAETLRVLTGERERLLTVRTEIEQRIAGLKADVAVQQQRLELAEKVLAKLRELESWWERWFGNADQQRIDRERAQKLEATKRETMQKIPELQRLVTHTLGEREEVDRTLGKIEREIREVEESKSAVAHYLRSAWEYSKWYIVIGVISYFVGPTLWKLSLYHGLAPGVTRGRPLKFNDDVATMPEVGESHVSVDVALWPGERVRVKEKFLQASDEGLVKKTRFMLDWGIPFTSIACGLIELVELRNTTAGAEYRVTFSNADDPHIELAVVSVPAGGSLILRPSFLAAVVTQGEEPPRIRRRWVLWRWLSWITLQFRFFEFEGPCRLIVAGTRGVRAETLIEREGLPRAARRTNQDATIGFTPNLEYRPVRAETFWAYYRDMNPLFDDLFAGRGLFICQETARSGPAAKAGRFWSAVWSGLLKVFGM